jgi:dipeptidyl aminopeptidase/acylaminoacyl peptidase
VARIAKLLRYAFVSLVWLSIIASLPRASGESAGPEKRRVTVADAIQMTRWADHEYFIGGRPGGRVAVFSPDSRRFVVVVKKGNLEGNTNVYSVLLFRTRDAFVSPKPRVLVRMSSSSNRDAIQSLKWLDDSRRLVFLGENLSAESAVYCVDVETGRLTKLTSQSTSILAYDISDSGHELIYHAAGGGRISMEDARRNGVVITTQHASDLIYCRCDSNEKPAGAEDELFVQLNGRAPVRISSSDFVTKVKPLSLSPNGRYGLLGMMVRDIPPSWAEYEDRLLHPDIVEKRKPGTPSNVMHYVLLDTSHRLLTPLLDAPMGWLNRGFAWAKDGNSIVLSGVYLPLDIPDPIERETRKKKSFVVEVKLPTKEVVKITDADLLVTRWDRATGKLLLVSEEWRKTLPPQAYRKIDSAWSQVPVTEDDTRTGHQLDATLEEDMNTPPKVFVSTRSHRKTLLLDLNPQFAQLQFGKVEAISWRATDGHEVTGGLYLPPDYREGERYPLVIQTHGFQKDKFWIDGPWSSAFAAQPLAARRIVVLQVGVSSEADQDLKYFNTPEEAPRQMAAYEGAIDYLDGRGVIDRNRVGIVGFSRTVFHVEYTLTHSKYQLAAVSLADGFDGGYLNYLLWPNTDSVLVNGGSPVGAGIASWLKNSPGFNLNEVRAPVRIEYYGRANFFGGWQLFSSLSLLGKPVDFVWLPYATHLLVKPWERLTSQQGNVDWFVFWLNGTEDYAPSKRGQYARWEELRSLPNQNDKDRDIPSEK